MPTQPAPPHDRRVVVDALRERYPRLIYDVVGPWAADTSITVGLPPTRNARMFLDSAHYTSCGATFNICEIRHNGYGWELYGPDGLAYEARTDAEIIRDGLRYLGKFTAAVRAVRAVLKR